MPLKRRDAILAVQPIRQTGKSNRSCRKRTPLRFTREAPQQDPIEHSVYLGRERLGRYLKFDCNRYRAFDADDRALGNFLSRPKALAAIRKARKVCS
jgi:hypothetical protein